MDEQRRAWVNPAMMDSAVFINPSQSYGMFQMLYNSTSPVSNALCRFDVYHGMGTLMQVRFHVFKLLA